MLERAAGGSRHCGAGLCFAGGAGSKQSPKQQGQDEQNHRFSHAPLPQTVHPMTECNLIGGVSSLEQPHPQR
jgi:hypothetical protein